MPYVGKIQYRTTTTGINSTVETQYGQKMVVILVMYCHTKILEQQQRLPPIPHYCNSETHQDRREKSLTTIWVPQSTYFVYVTKNSNSTHFSST